MREKRLIVNVGKLRTWEEGEDDYHIKGVKEPLGNHQNQ